MRKRGFSYLVENMLLAKVVATFVGSFILFTSVSVALTEAKFKTYDANSCSYANPLGVFEKQNCVSQPMKYWEGPWYDYRTNECGYRSASSCAPLPPGGLRIAMIGSSTTNGLGVRYEDMFSTRVESTLSAHCGKKVDVQNTSIIGAAWGGSPQFHRILDRLPSVLALKPNMLVMTIAALDIKFYDAPLAASRLISADAATATHILPTIADIKTVVGGAAIVRYSRSLMFRNKSLYLDRFIEDPNAAGYLFKSEPPVWRMRAQIMQEVLGGIIDKANRAGVPIVVVYFPPYPNAVAAQLATQFPALAPFGFDDAIKNVVIAHGGRYIDLTAEVAGHKDLTDLYYVSNEHPNAAGNALIADRLIKTLPTLVPALERCKGS